uniref:Ribonuclease PIN domain-containing protein n=1 Tax=Manihot esculenta TaxID=3983 RepID=A0A2C9WI77_MANES
METSLSLLSSTSSCWSNVVKSQPPPENKQNPKATNQLFVESCNSTKGISIAVIDANAVIEGGDKLHNLADRFVTVPEVLAEIRDPISRHRLSFVPFSIDSMEPTPEALNKVVKFARATGDLQTLSDVDLKLIALTYTLEAQIRGTKYVRDAPPPIHTVNVKRLPEKDLPGWGSNVPNLEEWEALEQEAGDGSNTHSRILPLKEMSLNVIPGHDQSEDGSSVAESEAHAGKREFTEQDLRKHRRYPKKKTEISIDGKKMVADGIDASQGQTDNDATDWMPAVSRSTHRRYLRRKARREYYEALSEKDSQQDLDKNMDNSNTNETNIPDPHQNSEGVNAENEISEDDEAKNDEDNLTSTLKQMRLEEGSMNLLQEGKDKDGILAGPKFADSLVMEAASENSVNCPLEASEIDSANEELDHQEILSQTNESIDVLHVDDDATVTVGENGIILADRRPRITLRGTKFSLPLPQGGRDAIAKNLILREDQLPQKFLYPKTKKKTNKEGDDFFGSDNIFNHHTDKRAPFQPPVRKALAVFSGKRNPNDNHYSRPKH